MLPQSPLIQPDAAEGKKILETFVRSHEPHPGVIVEGEGSDNVVVTGGADDGPPARYGSTPGGPAGRQGRAGAPDDDEGLPMITGLEVADDTQGDGTPADDFDLDSGLEEWLAKPQGPDKVVDSWDAEVSESPAPDDSWDAGPAAAPPEAAPPPPRDTQPPEAQEATEAPGEGSQDDDFDERALSALKAVGETAMPEAGPEAPTDAAPPQAPAAGAAGAPEDDQGETGADRTRFLESLLDGSETSLPKKVELDLDGIFDQAKKEAENLPPDSTHGATEAPKPAEPAEFEEPAPPPEPLQQPAQRKVSKLKLLFFLVPIVVGVALLLFGVYHIFFSGSEPVPEPELVLTDPLDVSTEPEPGELALKPFLVTLEGDDGSKAVAQIDFILHYHDTPDMALINHNLTEVRDLIFRITRSRGPALLSDANTRRQLQADLLTTLNELPAFKSENEQKLTYVQISTLRKR
jgi:flagellar basal body-associated protein FliL